MSQYLILSHIQVQNANSIAGLTWGFPAITSFTGFTHALSRKLSAQHQGNYDLEFTGCAVISNHTQNKVYQPQEYAAFEFIQSKNPPVLATYKNASPPIIEEGKVNITVSLVLEVTQSVSMSDTKIQQLETDIADLCSQMRLAGGTILAIQNATFLSASTADEQRKMLRKIKRLVMPGFVLLDRSDYLKEHYTNLKKENASAQLLDAWLDFSALKYKAIPHLKEDQEQPDEKTPADWQHQPKPNAGYLVPLMVGYKAISAIYQSGEVQNTRDIETPTRFVEAIHSVGEWKGAHAIQSIYALEDMIWHYKYDDEWYVCTQEKIKTSEMLFSEDLD